MADIVLKNKTGTAVTHTSVNALKVPLASGGTQKFQALSGMRFYTAKFENDKYLIIEEVFSYRTQDSFVFRMDSDYINEKGYAATSGGAILIMQIITANKLTPGNYYTVSDF